MLTESRKISVFDRCGEPLVPNTNDTILDKAAYGWYSTEIEELRKSGPSCTIACLEMRLQTRLQMEINK